MLYGRLLVPLLVPLVPSDMLLVPNGMLKYELSIFKLVSVCVCVYGVWDEAEMKND